MTDTESSERTPEFSLIVTTKDRTRELADLLQSLDRQRFRSFELIVSDQNADDRLLPVLAPFRQQFPLRHIRSAGGASRGRNAGLPLATGRYVGFPDDDCWYPPDLLAIVSRVFRDHPGWDIVCGRSVDGAMRNTQGRWFADVTQANRRNVLRIGIEYTIFARSAALAAAGPFDEALGVGAGTPWGSGEATDFLLSAVEARQTVIYTPEIYVHHPEKVADYSRRARDRQFAYARGFGRVLGKHGYSLLEALHHLARPLAGSVLFLARAQPERSLCHLRVFTGRSLGWLD